MLNYLFVMLGGALGSGARFWAAQAIERRWGDFFPIGTLAVNITGCFVIGLFAALTNARAPFPLALPWRLFFMVGVCGGYTTFSAFSLQTLDLAQTGQWQKAGVYTLLSVSCCLLAVWLGRACGLGFSSR